MEHVKRIALVAHDHMKADLTEWVKTNSAKLAKHHLVCTGTTGRMVEEALTSSEEKPLSITRLLSGPIGGDQQLGAMVAEGKIDIMVFFWDPMQPQPHDVDVKALLRISVMHNVPTASNLSTADFLIESPYFSGPYEKTVKDYSHYIMRNIS